jgi:hypothetical protein
MKIKEIHNAFATNSFEPWIATVLNPWLLGFEAGCVTVTSLNTPGNEESDETIEYA